MFLSSFMSFSMLSHDSLFLILPDVVTWMLAHRNRCHNCLKHIARRSTVWQIDIQTNRQTENQITYISKQKLLRNNYIDRDALCGMITIVVSNHVTILLYLFFLSEGSNNKRIWCNLSYHSFFFFQERCVIYWATIFLYTISIIELSVAL